MFQLTYDASCFFLASLDYQNILGNFQRSNLSFTFEDFLWRLFPFIASEVQMICWNFKCLNIYKHIFLSAISLKDIRTSLPYSMTTLKNRKATADIKGSWIL